MSEQAVTVEGGAKVIRGGGLVRVSVEQMTATESLPPLWPEASPDPRALLTEAVSGL